MRPLSHGAVLLSLFLSTIAVAQSAREERSDVQARLSAQRSTLELLRDQKVSVLEVLETVEKIGRSRVDRVRALDAELKLLKRRVDIVERQELVARRALEVQISRVGPRLRAMYRMTRKRPLDVLLSAEDFASLVWRSRALSRLVESDLELLAEVQRAARFQRMTARQLEGLKAQMDARLVVLREESMRAELQRKDLADLMLLIQAEQSQSSRVVRELEQAERELSALIADMEAPPAASGFGALKGRLPLPAPGRVEVGFGKVVNPKFNTVTVQKGVDVRAPAGVPVRAVAPGKVVYSAWMRGYGNLVILDHGGGFHTLVAHLADLGRAVGEEVQAGEVLGAVGDTASLKGAYVYFEIRQRGQAVDPAVWLAPAAGAAPR
jgi:murein hydrolase activator